MPPNRGIGAWQAQGRSTRSTVMSRRWELRADGGHQYRCLPDRGPRHIPALGLDAADTGSAELATLGRDTPGERS